MKIRLLYNVIFPSLFIAQAECAPCAPGRRKSSQKPKSLKWTEGNQIWIKIEILEGKEYTGR
jgi:hypothetical protein